MTFGTRVWALMPLAIAVNLVGGKLAALLRLPVYLDSLGTVLMGALCGPVPAALAGVASNLLLALTGDVMFLLFAPTAAAVGVLSGWLGRQGFFTRPPLALVGGMITGVAAAAVSAPISAYLLGGVTGGGTDLLVASFRALGRTALEASFAQGLISDPLDKSVTFLLVQAALALTPGRFRQAYPVSALHPDIRGPAGWSWERRRAVSAGGRQETWRPVPGGSLYVDRQSWMHRRSPLTKLLLLALLWSAALAASGAVRAEGHTMLAPALPLLAAAVWALSMSAGVGLELSRRILAFWLPLALSLLVIQGLFGPGPRAQAGWLVYSPQGLLEAAGLSIRIAVLLGAVLLLVLTTRPAHLAGELERLGLPPSLCYVILAGLQFLPAMGRRFSEVLDAQSARGLALEGGVLHRFRVLLPLAGPVLLGALAEVEERALALEARGFGRHRRRTWLWDPPGGPREIWWQLLLAGGLLAVGLTVAR
ncbi:MAG: energy-coupling factor transporter transmembrane protein EcfT [Armatimonadetes bacterium]|nr:energy-coupling factor transporter transmembrane protein EcfT [Armatimonadota bacterium]